jgi:hypothetical protein
MTREAYNHRVDLVGYIPSYRHCISTSGTSAPIEADDRPSPRGHLKHDERLVSLSQRPHTPDPKCREAPTGPLHALRVGAGKGVPTV